MTKMQRTLTLLLCAGLLALFLGCSGTSKSPSTGEYLDDSVITTKVKAAIIKDDDLKSYQIQVKTFKNVVQLSGFVDSRQVVIKAGEVARQVEGVKEVKNDLIVK